MINQFKVGWISLLAALVMAAPVAWAQEHIPDMGQFEFAGDSVVLPLTTPEGHPKLIVDVGDGEQHEFIVDTGASVNVIDSALAESLGYEVIGELEIGAPGGPQIPANIVKVPLVQVGGASIKDAEFVVMDIAKFSRGTTQGVLGTGLFRDYLLVFDRAQSEIRVSRDQLSADSAGVMSYDDVSDLVQIDMQVAGTTVATHIDTGSMGGFTLPIELKESLSLLETQQSSGKARLVGGDRELQHAQLDGDIQFAGATFEDPNVTFMDPSPGHGNIGSRILSGFVVSIDQKNHLIGFQKTERAATAGKEPRRLGVQFGAMPGGSAWTVGSVQPGSLAEASGFLAGDVLVALNDKPIADYDMKALGTLFRSWEPLSIEVEREGGKRVIDIQ